MFVQDKINIYAFYQYAKYKSMLLKEYQLHNIEVPTYLYMVLNIDYLSRR